MKRRTLLAAAGALPVAMAAPSVFGQSKWMPTKPIKIIVPFAPGSGGCERPQARSVWRVRDCGWRRPGPPNRGGSPAGTVNNRDREFPGSLVALTHTTT